MLATVTRLVPRTGSFKEALLAFRAAQLRNCLSSLQGVTALNAVSLRARTLLRIGDPRGALTALEQVATPHGHHELALLVGIAHSRLGDDEKADSAFRDAYVFSVSSMDVALEAEVEYYRGLTAFGYGDLGVTRSSCLLGLDAARTPQSIAHPSGIVPLDHVVSRIQELLGIVEAADGRYRDWIGHARQALATLDNCTIPDVYQEAFALRNLAILARDFDIEDDARSLDARVLALGWTRDIAHVEFTTAEALGWCSALRGNSVAALRLFRRAQNVASTDPDHVIIGVDRALLAREFGHRAMYEEEIENALGIAQQFDWERASGDSRDALLALAQAAAPIVSEQARLMLNRYKAIQNAMDTTYVARLEPRARAEEAYTDGLILRAEGRLTASSDRLQDAFETWRSIGFEWRAGRAALELAELDAGEVFRLAVRRELFQRPDSVFATRARLVA